MGDVRLIRWFFYLLVATMIAAAGLCAFLEVNDVVRVAQGELLADRPRTVYRAPFDVRVESTYVTEGNRVTKGQPLMVLVNEAVSSDLAQAIAEQEALQDEHRVVEHEIANAAERVAALRRQLVAANERFAVNASDTRDGESFQADQVRLADERRSLAQSNHDRSKLLLDKGMLTPAEYEQTRRALLDAEAGVAQARRQLTEQQTARRRLGADTKADGARLEAEILETEATRLSLIEREQRLARMIEKQDDVVATRRTVASRQRLVAETDGTIRFVFNTKAASNYIGPGEVLVEVAPPPDRGARVYAKLQPTQAVVRRLRPGQRAHIKLDSYYYYRYGPLRGTVRYISPPDDSSRYYVLVDLDAQRKVEVRPGYTVRAEIVVARMKLYAFIARKLLDRMDT